MQYSFTHQIMKRTTKNLYFNKPFQSLKLAGNVASVKYSFLTISTEQNLTYKNKYIYEIIQQ